MSGTPWSDWLLGREAETSSAERTVVDRLLDLGELRPGAGLVDLGAGYGTVAFAAAARVGPRGRILCVDADAGALAEAERRAKAAGLVNLEFIRADATALPLESGRLDAAFAKSLLYSLQDRGGVLREAFRVLAPGGRLALFEPLLRRESIWRKAPLDRLAEHLERAGHPAFTLDGAGLAGDTGAAGFRSVSALTWHADVTRTYAGGQEVLDDWEGMLPGELSLTDGWERAGVMRAELVEAAASLARDSARPGFADLLPCVFLGARKPDLENMA